MEFDVACFKELASNDTSAAPGHQAGIVIPKDIADFFPELVGNTSASEPTIAKTIKAELFFQGKMISKVETRYQYQTWHGKRSPERRLTGGLGPIRDKAAAGDIILFQRSLVDDLTIRLTLLSKGSAEYEKVRLEVGSERWGIVTYPPVKNTDFIKAIELVQTESLAPFKLFAQDQRGMSRVQRIARDKAFRIGVLQNFNKACVVSGRTLVAANGASGVDAAHIVPVARNGPDDIRNGIALSKDLHWAFDNGLIAIDSGIVIISDFVKSEESNDYLQEFAGTTIARANNFQTSTEAFVWHKENIFNR